MFRNAGPHWLAATSHHALGGIALAQGAEKEAAQWYEDELTIGRKLQNEMSLIFALYGLGKVAWVQEKLELAAQRFEEGWKLSREVGFEPAVIHALYGLGRVAQSRGEEAAAVAFFNEALEIHRQGTRHPNYPIRRWGWLKTYGVSAGYPLSALALLAANHSQMERAARLFSAAETLYPPLRFDMSAWEREEHDRGVAAARLALGEAAFAAAWAAGELMKLEQAIQEALALGPAIAP